MTQPNANRLSSIASHTATGVACWMVLLAGVPSEAAPKLKNDGRKLLTEGLDDLLNPPADKKKPAAAPTTNPSPAKPPMRFAPDERALNDLLRRSLNGEQKPLDLGEDLGQRRESPLVRVEKNMGEATRLIGKLDKTGKTLELQNQIVSDLDELIKKMEKQCQGSGQCNKPSSKRQQSKRSQPKQASSKQSQGKKPGQKQGKPQQSQSAAQQSVARLGSANGKAVEGRSTDELMKEAWGHLPQRLREQMLQGSTNEFLPQYREEIEKYFQRLAEEEAARSGGE